MKQRSIAQLQNIVWQHLNPGKTQAFIFGSHAANTTWRGSDIDLGIQGDVSTTQLASLREALENSTIPYSVDVVNFNQMNQDFVKLAKTKTIPL